MDRVVSILTTPPPAEGHSTPFIGRSVGPY